METRQTRVAEVGGGEMVVVVLGDDDDDEVVVVGDFGNEDVFSI